MYGSPVHRDQFQSTPPMQGATRGEDAYQGKTRFQSTPPMQGATVRLHAVRDRVIVSIHAPYAGSDKLRCDDLLHDVVFQSTPPMQGATNFHLCLAVCSKFQSTPPMQGATTVLCNIAPFSSVSIHAPYAGSDIRTLATHPVFISFNPRPLCRERHHQTRPSVRYRCFNPRPLCRERLTHKASSFVYMTVSIHAPYAGSDDFTTFFRDKDGVSIHAPYAGSDVKLSDKYKWVEHVSIHAPYAGSDICQKSKIDDWIVSIHAPYAGSDFSVPAHVLTFSVSIHAPYAGSDIDQSYKFKAFTSVSIHAPYAGSDLLGLKLERLTWFQSTPPMQGATRVEIRQSGHCWKFQSTPPMQGATLTRNITLISSMFQSTPPMQGATYSEFEPENESGVSIHAPYAGSDSNFSQKFFLIFSRNRQIIISNT